jgi:hypothetical protein
VKEKTTSTYLAYLLRLWRDDEAAPWRATVEDASTGQRFGFASLKALFVFLEQQTGILLVSDKNEMKK